MELLDVPADAPPVFLAMLADLRAAPLRTDVLVEQVPAPRRLAPSAVALSADVVAGGEDVASGRFVLLHDPLGQDGWEGTVRVVTLARAALEAELATDPLLGRAGWSWLEEALASRGVRAGALSGTVTRVVSESFAGLAERPASVEVEVRGSWTPPPDDVGTSLQAWADVMCAAGGLPPLPSGVVAFPPRGR
ncbi:Protein of unknown function [Quadrisphaera sp. DSM 44207]|nr:DUF3000 domain-containing protein [Quadrisphaera sp. DSM 44207]SDQ49500.1 Protein of unknown function [Quadrisphaera sp. DSM 44207]